MKKMSKALLILSLLIFCVAIITVSIVQAGPSTISRIYLKDGRVIECDVGWIEGDKFYYRKYGGTVGISLKTVDINKTYEKYKEKKKEDESQHIAKQPQKEAKQQAIARHIQNDVQKKPIAKQPQRQAKRKIFTPSPMETPKKQTGLGPFETLLILFFFCAVLYGAWKVISGGTSLIKRSIPPLWLIRNSRLMEMLDPKQYHELEALRKEFQISKEDFPLLVYTSSNLGTKIIKRDYQSLKKLYPNKSEKDILAKLLYNDMMSDPDLAFDEDTIAETIAQSLETINTLDELCDFISYQEYLKNPDFHDSVLGQRIEEIIGVMAKRQSPCQENISHKKIEKKKEAWEKDLEKKALGAYKKFKL